MADSSSPESVPEVFSFDEAKKLALSQPITLTDEEKVMLTNINKKLRSYEKLLLEMKGVLPSKKQRSLLILFVCISEPVGLLKKKERMLIRRKLLMDVLHIQQNLCKFGNSFYHNLFL